MPNTNGATGNFVKNVESVIATHVVDEASAFVPDTIATNLTYFNDAIAEMYESVEIKKMISERYPPSGVPAAKFKNEKDRYVKYTESQTFACHVRFIADAYKNKTYVAVYGRGSGKHGMDIKATFYDQDKAAPRDDAGFPKFASTYQHYLTSHARTGDPNSIGSPSVTWPKVIHGPVFKNVLMADNAGYRLVEGEATREDDCNFWIDVWRKASQSAGNGPKDRVS
jgi:carboxylesterase type B